MSDTVLIGAIDAGSNAIRAVVASAGEAKMPERVASKRLPVRLGHRAFTSGRLDDETIEAAVAAFREFRELFDEHGVEHYRAVATSALRASQNRDIVLHRLFHETGIELEVITGDEEARLVRKAVRNAFRGRAAPKTVLDLGGGSLEVNLRRKNRWRVHSLPVGTVRLMETMGLYGVIGEVESERVRRHTRTLLRSAAGADGPAGEPAAACGGNAEAFATLLQQTHDAMPCIELGALEELLPSVLEADVPGRMERFGVRKDRAEVMGAAGLVLAAAGRELGLERLLVPGVGVREALLFELAATLPGPE